MASRRGVSTLVRAATQLLQQGRQQQQQVISSAMGLSCQAAGASALPKLWAASQLPFGVRTIMASAAVRSQGLADVLKAELKFEKDNYQKPEQIAGSVPAPFKLTEEDGDTLLTLSRDYNGETVTVDLHVNNQPSPPFEGDEADEETVSTVVFNVTVKKASKSLVFECESDGNSVTINHISLEPKDGITSESMYTGPVFEELDDTLQGKFQSYLEERGISADLGEYLRFLIYDKEQREYQRWLGSVESFVTPSNS